VNPYLTSTGKWLFATGVILCLSGAALKEPALVFFGQLPVVVLLISLGLALPAGRAVDRRQILLNPRDPGAVPETIVLRAGQERVVQVWIENGSAAMVRFREFRAVVRGGLSAEARDLTLTVAPRQARLLEIQVQATGVGRCSLQGFDVVVTDRFGLVAVRDYLPSLQVFEGYPAQTVEERRRSVRTFPRMRIAPQRLAERRAQAGMDLRELREFQPGDPLRTVAWKATVRQRRLISKDFDEEQTHVEILALDISSSMRAGTPMGKKFEHSLQLVSELAGEMLESGLDVGLWTFDREVYGRVDVGRGRPHFRRIQRHLVGLQSVIDPPRTALDEEALEAEVADYLLVQEHLDFRGGQGPTGDLDRVLLRQWITAVLSEEERYWSSPAECFGVVSRAASPPRRFLRLRGIPLSPPSESRPGSTIAGIQAVLRDVMRVGPEQARLTFFTDLCGLSDVEGLERPLHVARRKGLEVRVIAPFTPAFATDPARESLDVTLFAAAERQDRLKVARRLRAFGIEVTFVGPYAEAVAMESSSAPFESSPSASVAAL
jgi:uncharacterized protein (DUF58 family)